MKPVYRAFAILLTSALALAQPQLSAAPGDGKSLVARSGPWRVAVTDGETIRIVASAGSTVAEVKHPGAIVADSLASDGRSVAYISVDTGDLWVLEPPRWRPRRLTKRGLFDGRPTFLPGGQAVLVGRNVREEGEDDGIWRIDARSGVSRRVEPGNAADLPVAGTIKVSPAGKRVAAGGGLTAVYWLRVLECSGFRSIRQPGTSGIPRLSDFAWRNDHQLFLAGVRGEGPGGLKGFDGIALLDLRKPKPQPWLTVSGGVGTVDALPGEKRLLICHGELAEASQRLPDLWRKLSLVDLGSRRIDPVRIPGPACVRGFSRDGRRVLLLALRPATKPTEHPLADAYVLDLKTRATRRVAQDVTDAAWMEAGRQ